jgi:hypothetical protein
VIASAMPQLMPHGDGFSRMPHRVDAVDASSCISEPSWPFSQQREGNCSRSAPKNAISSSIDPREALCRERREAGAEQRQSHARPARPKQLQLS